MREFSTQIITELSFVHFRKKLYVSTWDLRHELLIEIVESPTYLLEYYFQNTKFKFPPNAFLLRIENLEL